MIDSLQKKLEILVDSAKYDASCASSGSRGERSKTSSHGSRSGICHSWSADGRCISLLKILLSNACIYDCAYCVNRACNDIPRATLTPAEVVELTVNFYRRNYIEGLFLSTGVVKSPDYTMEQLIEAIRLLREDSRFGGYIHLKLVPGADARLVDEACRYADRVSVNIELPSEQSLGLLAPQKGRASILQPMAQVGRLIADSRSERRRNRKAPAFAPAGQSTQLIVGATPENDQQILALSESLYRRMDLKRVYYSAFIPVSSDSRLPAIPEPPLLREHRLYQADWLLRFYGFTSDEILSAEQPDLDPQLDPKAGWALRNLHLFPVEVNRVDYEMLLRVPGIGVRSARRILQARRVGPLDFDGLKRLGVVLKRARFFLTANGRYLGEGDLAPARLRSQMLALPAPKKRRSQQLELFEAASDDADHFAATVTGEL